MKSWALMMIATFVIILRPGTAIAGTADKTELLEALIQVESGGNDRAFGDRHKKEKAYGPLQVRQPCVDDVNRRYGTKIEAKNLLGDRAMSMWVCQKYVELYATRKQLGKEPTLEDMARIWNGGPGGWKRSDTLGYWSKVKRQMQKIEIARAERPAAKKPAGIQNPASNTSVSMLAVVR